MARLVGLGAGRTPAGDDYLVGHAAALHASGAAQAAPFGARLKALSVGTNAVSRTYLIAACAGEVSARLTAVAAVIAGGGDDAAVGRAVVAALAVGHSSGAAGVLGLLHGCAAVGATAPLPHASADTAVAATDGSARRATTRQMPPSSK